MQDTHTLTWRLDMKRTFKVVHRVTEYDVREIDAYGDVVDVNSFDTLDEARLFCEDIAPRSVAVVIERHKFILLADGIDNSEYETVQTTGSADALRAGEWIA